MLDILIAFSTANIKFFEKASTPLDQFISDRPPTTLIFINRAMLRLLYAFKDSFSRNLHELVHKTGMKWNAKSVL